MRKTKRTGSFFLCLLLNLIINLEWAIPGVIFLILHFSFGLSLWYAIIAFSVWIIVMIIWMLIIGWAGRCGDSSDPKKENKNPYSVRIEK